MAAPAVAPDFLTLVKALQSNVGVDPGNTSQAVCDKMCVALAQGMGGSVAGAAPAGTLPVVQQEDQKAKKDRELAAHTLKAIGKDRTSIALGPQIVRLIKDPGQYGEYSRTRVAEIFQQGDTEHVDDAVALKEIFVAAEAGKVIAELTGVDLSMRALQNVAHRKAIQLFALATVIDEEATEIKAGAKEWTDKFRRAREEAFVQKVLIPAASPVSATTRAMTGALHSVDPKSRKKDDDDEDSNGGKAKVLRGDGGNRGGRGDRGGDRGGRGRDGRGGGGRGGAPTGPDERLPAGFRNWNSQEKFDFVKNKGWCIKCAEKGIVLAGLKSDHHKH